MDQIAERLLSEDEKTVFQLFELIASAENYEQWTDNENYLMMQSDENTPIWLWIGEGVQWGSQEAVDIIYLLSERIAKNPGVHINAVSERFSKISVQLEEQIQGKVTILMPMNVYVCMDSYTGIENGRMISAERENTEEMKCLLIQLVEDGEREKMTDDVAEQVVEAMIASENVYLWEAGGEICSMAMVAHRGTKFTRINTVVTERSHRGHGYAGMLVAAMCREELQKGKKVMLYADAENPSSNRTYQKIGFRPVGKIAEYKIEKSGKMKK